MTKCSCPWQRRRNQLVGCGDRDGHITGRCYERTTGCHDLFSTAFRSLSLSVCGRSGFNRRRRTRSLSATGWEFSLAFMPGGLGIREDATRRSLSLGEVAGEGLRMPCEHWFIAALAHRSNDIRFWTCPDLVDETATACVSGRGRGILSLENGISAMG